MARVIVKARRRPDHYVRLDRALLESPRLSWQAKALLAHLLDRGSHPDGWETTVDDIVAKGTDGERAVRGGFAELEAAGYLTRGDSGVGGRGRRAVWQVTDDPANGETHAKREGLPDAEGRETQPVGRESAISHLLIKDSKTMADESAKVLRAGLWTALERALGPAKTRTENSIRGRTLEELRKVGATPDEIIARAVTYRARYPRAALTDSALRKHWTALETPARKPKERIADPQLRSLYEANQ